MKRETQAEEAMFRALQTGAGILPVAQPIVDIKHGAIAGYELLARFEQGTLAEWFSLAESMGCRPALEARILERALSLKQLVPKGAFLTVNLSPDAVQEAEAVFAGAGRLDGIVVELTEHVPVADYSLTSQVIDGWVRRGAMLAIDDAGAGYASMQHILALRPQFVKLDRAFIDGCDQDPGRLAAIEMLGRLAGRINAWVIAEGVEQPAELQALMNLGVPLAQGFFLARPSGLWPTVEIGAADVMRNESGSRAVPDPISLLLEPGNTSTMGRSDDVLIVDSTSRPEGMLMQTLDGPLLVPASELLIVPRTASIREVAVRAMARDDDHRFRPIVCIDEFGAYAGHVACEALILWLASPPALRNAGAPNGLAGGLSRVA